MEDDLDYGRTLVGLRAGQKVFGRYTLKKILGRGGMGVVWLARDESLETDVALKFLPEAVAHDPAAVNDLKRETRRSLQLTHPSIVRIFDFVQDERAAAISMEYVEGATLTQLRLARPNQVFEVEELQKWLGQLCEALDYAHNKAKVVHRDLKPANLLIDAQGDLKITDFGISATLSDSTTRVSKVAGTSGTPVYMSPQQMMGEKPAATDDIYSVGATLYELLTGKPPFYTGRIEMQVMSKVAPSVDTRAVVGSDGGQSVEFQRRRPAGGKRVLDRGDGVLPKAYGTRAGREATTGRLRLYATDRSSVGVCVPGGNYRRTCRGFERNGVVCSEQW